MTWYVAVVALLNLGFGYLIARMLGVGKGPVALAVGETVAELSDDSEYEAAE